MGLLVRAPRLWGSWASSHIVLKMVGWHHHLDGHESEQALGVDDGQRSLVSCGLWGCKESDTTE